MQGVFIIIFSDIFPYLMGIVRYDDYEFYENPWPLESTAEELLVETVADQRLCGLDGFAANRLDKVDDDFL